MPTSARPLPPPLLTQVVGLGAGYSLNVASAEAAPEQPTPQVRALQGVDWAASGRQPVLGRRAPACLGPSAAPIRS